MISAHNLLYILVLVALHLLFVVVWILMRRTCFACCPVSPGNDDSPDSQEESAAEQELEINRDDSAGSSRWFLSWREMTHRTTRSTTNILQSVFDMDQSESASRREEGNNSSQVYVALPIKLAERLSPVELEMGTFAGSTEDKFGNIYRMSKLKRPTFEASSPGSPSYLSAELLRGNATAGPRSAAVSYKKETAFDAPTRNVASPQSARRGRPLVPSLRTSAVPRAQTVPVPPTGTEVVLQSSLSTLTSASSAPPPISAQWAGEPLMAPDSPSRKDVVAAALRVDHLPSRSVDLDGSSTISSDPSDANPTQMAAPQKGPPILTLTAPAQVTEESAPPRTSIQSADVQWVVAQSSPTLQKRAYENFLREER
jgi:hypothetical protein